MLSKKSLIVINIFVFSFLVIFYFCFQASCNLKDKISILEKPSKVIIEIKPTNRSDVNS